MGKCIKKTVSERDGGIELLPIITISRQMCSLGDEIAAQLARKLGGQLLTRDKILAQNFINAAGPLELRMLSESPKYYLRQINGGETYRDYLEEQLRRIALSSTVVIVGMGSQVIFAGDPQALHIRATASIKTRILRLKKEYHVSDEEAEKILAKADRKHKRYVSTLYGIDSTDPSHYDLILATDSLSVSECTRAVLAILEEREYAKTIQKQDGDIDFVSKTAKPPVFKNPAEEEFAGILDMYQMDWEYEPKTFPIEWDAEGNITMAFSPDFYLPKFDTYIEITTMNQKYVTTKNKKVKKLRELYPGVSVSIVYKNDFNSLISRFRSSKGEDE